MSTLVADISIDARLPLLLGHVCDQFIFAWHINRHAPCDASSARIRFILFHSPNKLVFISLVRVECGVDANVKESCVSNEYHIRGSNTNVFEDTERIDSKDDT